MRQSKFKDRSAHARDPKLPYFDDRKDKMDSYWSRLEKYAMGSIFMGRIFKCFIKEASLRYI